MKFVIRNGTVVTPRDRYAADLVCEDGLITALEEPDSASGSDDEVDATLQQIGRAPTTALALTKWLFYKLDSLSFDDGIAAGVVTNVEARSTEDFRKGVRKFTERRSRPE